MAGLTLTDVTKVYRGDKSVTATKDINLEVQDGEFLVLVGPSGCGKSSTLRMIAGLEEVTDGIVEINNEIVTEQAPQKRNIAMVFQNYALYPHMTVRENMSFGIRLSSEFDEEEIASTVEKTAQLLEISELLDQYPRQLSGGQKQRVALGRAIVRDPAVFLLDEPLSNLDAKLRTQMRTELQRLQSELGVTTVYVTHDQTEAMTMGDRIAVLDSGEIQQVAPPEVCYNRPSNRFVAGFIGSPSMNFFEVHIKENQGDHIIEGDSFVLTINGICVTDGRYTLGVRPEDFYIGESEGIQATVDVVEPLGADNLLYLTTTAGDEFTVRVESNYKPNEGETVFASFDTPSMHLFDNGGNRVEVEQRVQGEH